MATTSPNVTSIGQDAVVERLLSYVRAHSHAMGAAAFADLCSREQTGWRLAQTRRHETAEHAATCLHDLALALFADPGDALAHEQFVEDLEAARDGGWADGFDQGVRMTDVELAGDFL